MKTKLLLFFLLIGISVLGQEKKDTLDVKKDLQEIKDDMSKINGFIKDIKSDLTSKLNQKEDSIKKLKKQQDIDTNALNKFKSERDKQKNIYSVNLDSINSLDKQINDLKKSLLEDKNNSDTTKVNKLNVLIKTKKTYIDKKTSLELEDSSLKNQSETEKGSDNLTYLNAYNFDFNTTDKTTGYLGNLNLFFNIKNLSITKWYINAGLKKIDYAFSNNNVTEDVIDNVKLKPLQNVTAIGDKYLTQYNRYTTSTKIRAWSGYFQLLHKITKIKNLYAHLHTELQISKVNFKTSIQTLDTITNKVTDINSIPTLYNSLDKEYEIDKTYFGYYFGTGITGDFLVVDDSKFKLRYFVQFTAGYSNIKSGNSASINAFQKIKDNYSDFTPNFDSNNHFFHLFNTYVSNKINGLDLIIGSEIRGNFISPPLYIFYVGINTDLDKIAKLFQ